MKSFPFVIGDEFTPHIPNIIFGHLDRTDRQALVNCRAVSRPWKEFVDFRTSLWKKVPASKYQEAAAKGLIDVCRLIVPYADDKLPADEIGETPLHSAAQGGHLEVCKLILDNIDSTDDAQINPPNTVMGTTPLHHAAFGNLEISRLIIERVDDKNPSDKYGNTPMHQAAFGKQLSIFQLLMESVEDINPANVHGETPLHGAAMVGSTEVCKLILGKANDKNPPSLSGMTPLHEAARMGHLDVVRLFLEIVEDLSNMDFFLI